MPLSPEIFSGKLKTAAVIKNNQEVWKELRVLLNHPGKQYLSISTRLMKIQQKLSTHFSHVYGRHH